MINSFSKGIRLFGWCLLFNAYSVSAYAQFFGDKQAKLVVTEPLEFQFETLEVEAVGTAEAVRSIILYSPVSDEVTEVNFVPGQFVEAGKVLVRLDDRRQRVAVERAKLQLTDAERTYKRLQQSSKQGAIPESELDLAQTARDLAKVALEEAQADLDDRQIEAPFDGVVGITDIEVGDRINDQTAITTLDDRSKLFVNFRAPEASLEVLLNSPMVTLEPWSNRNKDIKAEIAEVDSRINEVDRTLRARAVLDNSQDRYRPGMSFRVNLSINGNQYAAIPEAALLWGATGAYVWIAENGKAKRVDVKVHQRLRGTILVSGELEEGDTLISEGIQRLREGQDITTELARSAADE
ncbi:efflux RND transporter periplasmic adaptor subunit [Alteromonas pelagimontana]|uniref:Efflux RND transporter periplasmic adaptor subunit n=1 Tax=Alteromonas pelagimontana TaxID=1858656 RepID=A0A6M4M9Q4_9ALTE|nr:efflux RND transporter periplasmic adaptor subunit [Alteromonas pelagimontana]QJR79847.1 efflux RND transporter periplasmic adaptor subunit [Alteromonas pelagimontana]